MSKAGRPIVTINHRAVLEMHRNGVDEKKIAETVGTSVPTVKRIIAGTWAGFKRMDEVVTSRDPIKHCPTCTCGGEEPKAKPKKIKGAGW